MARCGCSGFDGCACVVQASGSVSVTGTGTSGDPYVVQGPVFDDTSNESYEVTVVGDGTPASPLRWTVTPRVYATGSRPSASTAGIGAMIYDSTLGIPIWSNGTTWRNAAGVAV